AQGEAPLAKTMPHSSIALAYMGAKDLALAEDLRTVYAHARFQAASRKHGGAQHDLKMIPPDFFWRAAVLNNEGQGAPGANAEEDVAQADAPAETETPEAADAAGTGTAKKMSLKTETLVGDAGGILDIRSEKIVNQANRDLEVSFTEVLDAIHIASKRSLPLERARPDSREVRLARRVFLDTARQSGNPTAELAQIMVSYAVPKLPRDVSRLHAQQSAGDSTDTASFIRAQQHVEKTFGAAFNDIELWRDSSMVQCDGDLDGMKDLFLEPGLLFTVIKGPSQRWSTAGVHSNVDKVTDCLANAIEMPRRGNYFSIDAFWGSIGMRLEYLRGWLMDFRQQFIPVQEKILDMDHGLRNYNASLIVFGGALKDLHNRGRGSTMAFSSCAGGRANGKFDESDLSKLTFELTIDRAVIQLQDVVRFVRLSVDIEIQTSRATAKEQFETNVISMAVLNREVHTRGEPDFRNATCSAMHESLVKEMIDQMKRFIGGIGDWARAMTVDARGVEGSRAGIPGTDWEWLGELVLGMLRPVYIGDEMYRQGQTLSVESAINSIEIAPRSTAGEIHKDVIGQAKTASIFQMIFRDVTNIDSPVAPGAPVGSGDVTEELGKLKHNMAQKNLTEFMNASGLKDSVTPSRRGLTEASQKFMAKDDVFTLINIANETRDLASRCATRQIMLFKNVAGTVAKSILRLDQAFNSDDALHLEGNGREPPMTLLSPRGWLSNNAAIFSKKAGARVLEITAAHLEAQPDKCMESAPPSGAAFNQGRMDTRMANRIFGDSLGNVVKQYNMLHQCLSKVSAAWDTLAIAPNVQVHEVTARAVAVGVEML
ncbi:unnamed protein product, partial [Prorocentrum cordatum]